MSIQWNRATSKTIACAAILLVSSCAAETEPVPAAQAESAGETAPGSQHAEVLSKEASQDAAEGLMPEPEAAPAEAKQEAKPANASGDNSGLDELDMGFDVGELEIDLGQQGTPATGMPLAGSGLRKPQAATSSTRGGIRLARGESSEHSFGDVREGEAYTKNFKFVSDGATPLVVKSIKPSCGCTKSEIELIDANGVGTPYDLGNEIPVGQKFELLTEISTDGKHGHTEVTVMMTSNDPKGQTGIKLTAEVENVLTMDPSNQMVLIDEMTVLQQRTHELQVRSTRGELFKLAVGPEVQLPDSIKVNFTPVDPDAEGRAAVWDVNMLLGPGLDEGRRNYPIYLASDIEIPRPKYPNADGTPKFFTSILSVQVNVIGLVSASPSFLGFGIVKPGQEVIRTVDISCADGTLLKANPEVKILGLYDENAQYADAYDITFEPLEGQNGMRMNVRLTGMAKDVKGSFGGRIVVAIEHPAKETLTVKFSGICRAVLPGQ